MPNVKHRVTKRGRKTHRIKGGRHVGEPPYQHDLDTERPHYTAETLRPGHQFGHKGRKPKKLKKTARVL